MQKQTCGKSQIEYAIGSPSIEQIFNSYNKKYRTTKSAKAFTSTGYKISNTEGPDNTFTGALFNCLNSSDNVYVPSSNKIWISSPSASGENNLIYIDSSGTISSQVCNSYDTRYLTYPRPVIALKEDIIIYQKPDGSFMLDCN